MQRRQLIKSLFAISVGCAFGGLTSTAFARRGRPATPTSVGGVRRRTRRRTRRRVSRNMRLTSLPYGCNVTRVRGGWHGGGVVRSEAGTAPDGAALFSNR